MLQRWARACHPLSRLQSRDRHQIGGAAFLYEPTGAKCFAPSGLLYFPNGKLCCQHPLTKGILFVAKLPSYRSLLKINTISDFTPQNRWDSHTAYSISVRLTANYVDKACDPLRWAQLVQSSNTAENILCFCFIV